MKSNVCLAIAELANSIEITAVLQIVTFLSLDIFKSQKFIEAAVKMFLKGQYSNNKAILTFLDIDSVILKITYIYCA